MKTGKENGDGGEVQRGIIDEEKKAMPHKNLLK